MPIPKTREEAPADPQIAYREAEIAGALASDVLFFLRHRDRFHHVRRATSGEIKLVQIIERRLLEPTEGCVPIVLIQRVDDRHRKRVIIEAMGIDCDAVDEAEAAALYDVTANGWTAIDGGRHETRADPPARDRAGYGRAQPASRLRTQEPG